MPVFCADGHQRGEVDRGDGDHIRLIRTTPC
ncbi:DUF2171 domain-containing protein [Deinococcus budaensis]